MLEFIIGIVVGILLSFIVVAFSFANQEKIAGLVSRSSHLLKLPKEKAEFFGVGNAEVDAIQETMEENDKRGRPTELKEIL